MNMWYFQFSVIAVFSIDWSRKYLVSAQCFSLYTYTSDLFNEYRNKREMCNIWCYDQLATTDRCTKRHTNKLLLAFTIYTHLLNFIDKEKTNTAKCMNRLLFIRSQSFVYPRSDFRTQNLSYRTVWYHFKLTFVTKHDFFSVFDKRKSIGYKWEKHIPHSTNRNRNDFLSFPNWRMQANYLRAGMK